MALRWAKAYRPGLLPELDSQGPSQAQAWAKQKAEQVLEDFSMMQSQLEQENLSAPEMNTRLRLISEAVLASQFPAMSGGRTSLCRPGSSGAWR